MARRANAVVLLDQGWSCERVAAALLLDDDTVRDWYRAYERGGVAGPKSFGHEGSSSRRFGDVWLGWRLWRALALDRFCEDRLVEGRERAPLPAIAAILVIARLCEPASELHIAEDWYRRTALDDLLGVPAERVNYDRLYRALDRLLPHKQALETHLKERLGRCSISTMSCCDGGLGREWRAQGSNSLALARARATQN